MRSVQEQQERNGRRSALMKKSYVEWKYITDTTSKHTIPVHDAMHMQSLLMWIIKFTILVSKSQKRLEAQCSSGT